MGFETLTWRARLGPDRRIATLVRAEIREGGERPVASLRVENTAAGRAVLERAIAGADTGSGPETLLAVLGEEGPVCRVRGGKAEEAEYRRSADGSLSIVRRPKAVVKAADGSYALSAEAAGLILAEEWSAAGAGSSKSFRDGGLFASGVFGPSGSPIAWSERRAGDPEGFDILEWSLDARDGRLRVAISAAEPIATLLAEGLPSALSGEVLLGNLALLELALGPDHRATPLFARLSFEAARRGE